MNMRRLTGPSRRQSPPPKARASTGMMGSERDQMKTSDRKRLGGSESGRAVEAAFEEIQCSFSWSFMARDSAEKFLEELGLLKKEAVTSVRKLEAEQTKPLAERCEAKGLDDVIKSVNSWLERVTKVDDDGGKEFVETRMKKILQLLKWFAGFDELEWDDDDDADDAEPEDDKKNVSPMKVVKREFGKLREACDTDLASVGPLITNFQRLLDTSMFFRLKGNNSPEVQQMRVRKIMRVGAWLKVLEARRVDLAEKVDKTAQSDKNGVDMKCEQAIQRLKAVNRKFSGASERERVVEAVFEEIQDILSSSFMTGDSAADMLRELALSKKESVMIVKKMEAERTKPLAERGEIKGLSDVIKSMESWFKRVIEVDDGQKDKNDARTKFRNTIQRLEAVDRALRWTGDNDKVHQEKERIRRRIESVSKEIEDLEREAKERVSLGTAQSGLGVVNRVSVMSEKTRSEIALLTAQSAEYEPTVQKLRSKVREEARKNRNIEKSMDERYDTLVEHEQELNSHIDEFLRCIIEKKSPSVTPRAMVWVKDALQQAENYLKEPSDSSKAQENDGAQDGNRYDGSCGLAPPLFVDLSASDRGRPELFEKADSEMGELGREIDDLTSHMKSPKRQKTTEPVDRTFDRHEKAMSECRSLRDRVKAVRTAIETSKGRKVKLDGKEFQLGQCRVIINDAKMGQEQIRSSVSDEIKDLDRNRDMYNQMKTACYSLAEQEAVGQRQYTETWKQAADATLKFTHLERLGQTAGKIPGRFNRRRLELERNFKDFLTVKADMTVVLKKIDTQFTDIFRHRLNKKDRREAPLGEKTRAVLASLKAKGKK